MTGDRVQVWGRLDHFQTKDNRQVLSMKADEIEIIKAKEQPEPEPEAEENGGWS